MATLAPVMFNEARLRAAIADSIRKLELESRHCQNPIELQEKMFQMQQLQSMMTNIMTLSHDVKKALITNLRL